MQTKLVNFIGALRNHEVRISPAESLDAMRVLALIGYSDKQRFKNGLKAALTKTFDEKAHFEQCFELFYGGNRLQASSSDDAEPEPHASFDLQAEIAADPALQKALDAELVEILIQDDQAKLSATMAQAASNIETQKLRYFTQTGQFTQKLLQNMGSEQLDNSIKELQAMASDNANAGFIVDILKNRKLRLRALAREMIEEQYLLTANAEGRKLQENALRSARLSNLERKHYGELQELVRKLSKKLSARHSQRLHQVRRGKLNVTKTLRKSIQHDGIMFETYWKKKRKDQPKVIAFCDISNSVAAYAKFLLLFLYSLNDVLPKVRSFCFSNRTGEVTDLFERFDAAKATEMAFKEWGQGSSDYGQSLRDFAELCIDDIDNNTTVIILGDGRNNHGNPHLEVLQDVYNRAKTVIWLNPERRSSWGTGDSEMRRYQSACHFVTECQSLQQLERVVDQLLKLIR